jgi:hypothetical protein
MLKQTKAEVPLFCVCLPISTSETHSNIDLALFILASHYPRYDPALRHHKFTLVCRLNPEVKAAQNNPCFSPIDNRQLHEKFVDGISVVPRPSGTCDHNVKRDFYESNILAAASVRLDPQC